MTNKITPTEIINKLSKLKKGEKFTYHTGFIIRDAQIDLDVRQIRDYISSMMYTAHKDHPKPVIIENRPFDVFQKIIGTRREKTEVYNIYEYTAIGR